MSVLEGEEAAIQHWLQLDPSSLRARVRAQIEVYEPTQLAGAFTTYTLDGCTPLLLAAASPHTHVLSCCSPWGRTWGPRAIGGAFLRCTGPAVAAGPKT